MRNRSWCPSRVGRRAVLAVGGLLIALAAGGAGTAQSVGPTEGEAVRAEVRAFLTSYREAMNAFDVERLGGFYSAAPEFRWVEPGRGMYRSREEVVTGLAAAMARFDQAELALDDVRIVPLSGDAAALFFHFNETFGSSRGPEDGLSFSGDILAVVVREEGRWRFLVGQVAASPDADR